MKYPAKIVLEVMLYPRLNSPALPKFRFIPPMSGYPKPDAGDTAKLGSNSKYMLKGPKIFTAGAIIAPSDMKSGAKYLTLTLNSIPNMSVGLINM